MKNVTKRIIENFPNLEKTKEIHTVEATFLHLAWFFEDPENQDFNIGLLYKHLDNDWLELALELIAQFFREETHLIQEPVLSFIRKGSNEYFNQTQFADFLSERGLKYDKRKLNVYYKRGKLPKTDVEISGTPFWSKSTVEDFCEQEKKRLKKDCV
ncbi:hypothetical protein [Metabacillus litoralis]|uniref:hypothetical protein n=1 Tax=Metabacillus litoralis TaxID=152268 RepID=UPI00203DEF70|nr:hypothetical protein [Metabacillus litoralis]MCM3655129.1 hypothetical protein [Metabacillus litoralis]